MEVLEQHLKDSGVPESILNEKIVSNIWKKGFETIADLEYLESQDLEGKLN